MRRWVSGESERVRRRHHFGRNFVYRILLYDARREG